MISGDPAPVVNGRPAKGLHIIAYFGLEIKAAHPPDLSTLDNAKTHDYNLLGL
jgi:hypothetical protein